MARKQNKKFNQDIGYRIGRLKRFGNKYGWRLLSETQKVLVFESFHNWGYVAKSSVRMKVDFMQLQVETMLNHPVKGFTTLCREGKFSMTLIEKIFCNPRAHMPDIITSTYKK